MKRALLGVVIALAVFLLISSAAGSRQRERELLRDSKHLLQVHASDAASQDARLARQIAETRRAIREELSRLRFEVRRQDKAGETIVVVQSSPSPSPSPSPVPSPSPSPSPSPCFPIVEC